MLWDILPAIINKAAIIWIAIVTLVDRMSKFSLFTLVPNKTKKSVTQEQYRELQKLGNFDAKNSSSWLKTPSEIRKLGGAIFGDRRYGHVFVYHNGADSYYGSRGFRGSLRV